MHKTRVYIATNYDRAAWIDSIVATALEARGCEVVSSWHKPPHVAEDLDAMTPDTAYRIRARNLLDLSRAHVCLVFSTMRGGEHHGEATLAYQAGLTLVWEGRDILLSKQPGVVRVWSIDEAYDAVTALATRRTPTYPPVSLAGVR